MDKKKGFTLAEALVTIGIIGLISAIVIPTFIKNTTQQEMVARVMTSYNSLQTAYEQVKMNQKNRPPQFWDGNVLNLFAEQMGATSATFSAYETFNKTGAGTANSAASAIELKNGSVVTYVVGSDTCTSATGGRTCGTFYVDVNGSQKPNIAGVDVFAFSMTKNGIVPEGSGDDSLLGANCPTVGESCTAHVVANNNLSYLEGATPGETPNNPSEPTTPTCDFGVSENGQCLPSSLGESCANNCDYPECYNQYPQYCQYGGNTDNGNTSCSYAGQVNINGTCCYDTNGNGECDNAEDDSCGPGSSDSDDDESCTVVNCGEWGTWNSNTCSCDCNFGISENGSCLASDMGFRCEENCSLFPECKQTAGTSCYDASTCEFGGNSGGCYTSLYEACSATNCSYSSQCYEQGLAGCYYGGGNGK